jgi:hypothetical protein
VGEVCGEDVSAMPRGVHPSGDGGVCQPFFTATRHEGKILTGSTNKFRAQETHSLLGTASLCIVMRKESVDGHVDAVEVGNSIELCV